jgi:hypothetical protein
MSLEFYKSAFEKIINSGIIQNIYPMVDHVDVKYFRWNLNGPKPGYLINLDIVVDSPDMTEDNMYDLDFDPHYLVDKYIRDFAKYLSINIFSIFFTVHNLEGDLIHEWAPF